MDSIAVLFPNVLTMGAQAHFGCPRLGLEQRQFTELVLWLSLVGSIIVVAVVVVAVVVSVDVVLVVNKFLKETDLYKCTSYCPIYVFATVLSPL